MEASNRTFATTSANEDMDFLPSVIHASSEAYWCMSFGIPVDVSAPDMEVVRQVFENDPYWSFSNPAMAQLYLLPGDQSFNNRPVSEIFPRNAKNEEFVLNLIRNGFEVDRAPALDARYDGVEIEVENDVRAQIEDGLLIRMFGIVRDVGKHRRREAALQSQLDITLSVLNSVSAPVIALDAEGEILFANLKSSQLFGTGNGDFAGLNAAVALSKLVDRDTAIEIVNVAKRVVENGIPATRQISSPKYGYSWSIAFAGSSDVSMAVITAVRSEVEAFSDA